MYYWYCCILFYGTLLEIRSIVFYLAFKYPFWISSRVLLLNWKPITSSVSISNITVLCRYIPFQVRSRIICWSPKDTEFEFSAIIYIYGNNIKSRISLHFYIFNKNMLFKMRVRVLDKWWYLFGWHSQSLVSGVSFNILLLRVNATRRGL